MNAESVKARLKNIAKQTGKSFQDVLVSYGIERTLYRLSISDYQEKFILKGGIFLYALYEGDYPRATVDIDFLARNISNDIEKIRKAFVEIFEIDTEDPLNFETNTLEVKPITEFKEYHGVNMSIIAYLDRTQIPISIDIGFGDVIYPDRVLMDFPVLLSEESPKVYAYSIYSSIAEKFEAIVSLGYDNSRFKDFYDIYINAVKYEFDGQILAEAFKETFANRRTELGFIAAFSEDYAKDEIRIIRWKNFAKKKKVSLECNLEETIEVIRTFIMPIIESIKDKNSLQARWIGKEKKWIDYNDLKLK